MIPESMTDLIGVWVAGFLTLCVLSFLFKDNVLFKLMEALYVGVSVGYGVALTWHTGLYPKVVVPFADFVRHVDKKQAQDWIWAVYMLLSIGIGMLFLPRLTGEKHAWLSRFPMAYSMGVGTGMGLPLAIQTFILAQVNKALIPLVVVVNGQINWWASLGNCTITLGTLSVLYYFFFSLKKTDVVSRGLSKVGIAYLMFAFGASFAYTIMARISLLIGRVAFLKDDWIGGTLRFFGFM